jgi:hypothetical protein
MTRYAIGAVALMIALVTPALGVAYFPPTIGNPVPAVPPDPFVPPGTGGPTAGPVRADAGTSVNGNGPFGTATRGGISDGPQAGPRRVINCREKNCELGGQPRSAKIDLSRARRTKWDSLHANPLTPPLFLHGIGASPWGDVDSVQTMQESRAGGLKRIRIPRVGFRDPP